MRQDRPVGPPAQEHGAVENVNDSRPFANAHGKVRDVLSRSWDAELARKVAEQLSAGDQLVTHMRDELGLEDSSLARPLQAALVSAASFASLALLPIAALLLAPSGWHSEAIVVSAVISLAVLGGVGGRLGGAPVLRAALRAVVGGGLAMAITAVIGHLLGLIAVR